MWQMLWRIWIKKHKTFLEVVKNIANNTKYFSLMEEKMKENVEKTIRKYKEYFENAIDV
ncbi:hypothetical protein TheetDRAFT_3232, partial [Thermoanaerobacter ethanolicus JW 200]